MPTPEFLVYGIFSLLGAVVRVILKGVWTWRAFLVGFVSVGFAVPIATLIVYFVPGLDDAPIWVIGSVYTIVAVFSIELFERAESVRIEAKLGGFEVSSKPDGED